jgi:hypothetical protein
MKTEPDEYKELGTVKHRTVSVIHRDGVNTVGLSEKCGNDPHDTAHLLSAVDARNLAMLLLEGADRIDPVERPITQTPDEQRFWDRAFLLRASVFGGSDAHCAAFADSALIQRRLSSGSKEEGR